MSSISAVNGFNLNGSISAGLGLIYSAEKCSQEELEHLTGALKRNYRESTRMQGHEIKMKGRKAFHRMIGDKVESKISTSASDILGSGFFRSMDFRDIHVADLEGRVRSGAVPLALQHLSGAMSAALKEFTDEETNQIKDWVANVLLNICTEDQLNRMCPKKDFNVSAKVNEERGKIGQMLGNALHEKILSENDFDHMIRIFREGLSSNNPEGILNFVATYREKFLPEVVSSSSVEGEQLSLAEKFALDYLELCTGVQTNPQEYGENLIGMLEKHLRSKYFPEPS